MGVGIWWQAGHPHSRIEGVCVAILLKNKALAFITSSGLTYVGSAGMRRCPQYGCSAVPADVCTLGSKP